MSVDKVCSRIAGFINNSNRTQRVLKGIGKNPAIFSAVASFGLASVIRPALLEKMPFKDDKDRKASQASAISSGLTDLVTTVAIFLPLNKGIGKASGILANSKNTFFNGNEKAVNQFKSITNRGFKLLFLVPISIARMKLIKPLINGLKGKDLKKRKLDKWA